MMARMADDDRFAKKLGWGYKKTYKLAHSGETGTVVARSLIRAISRQMRKGGFPALQQVIAEITRAVASVCAARGELFDSTDVSRTEFNRNLDAISARHSFDQSTRMLCAVAGQVFEHQQRCGDASTDGTKSLFAEHLATKLADHHLLAVAVGNSTVRLELMRKSGRDVAEQREFERNLVLQSVPAIAGLLEQALKDPKGIPKRTPRLPHVENPFSMHELHEVLS